MDSKKEEVEKSLSEKIMQEWIESNEWTPLEHSEEIIFGDLSSSEEEYWSAPLPR